MNRDADPPRVRRRAGVFASLVLLIVSGGIASAIASIADAMVPAWIAMTILGLLASSCLAQRSLDAHVRAVADALEDSGIEAARGAVAMIVGRDTVSLDVAGVSRAAIESLAENFADGIVAPTVWLALGGLSGGVLYKAINTADSMIGHRTPRHEDYGWASAKLDDAVNWPAARLASLAIVVAAALVPGASSRDAWRIMRRDARGHPSPNAGWPEAAMAGALGIRLGGSRSYGGRLVVDATMGDEASDGAGRVDSGTIRRALRLYRTACALNIVVVVAALMASAS